MPQRGFSSENLDQITYSARGAGAGFGWGFLPFDSFFLSLVPMIFSPC